MREIFVPVFSPLGADQPPDVATLAHLADSVERAWPDAEFSMEWISDLSEVPWYVNLEMCEGVCATAVIKLKVGS